MKSWEKLRKFSDSVWVCFEAVIIEKTLKEEWTNKNHFYDNYKTIIVGGGGVVISVVSVVSIVSVVSVFIVVVILVGWKKLK